MKHEINEEKLTAYVLGEVSPDEAKAVEMAAETDAGLRSEIEELRSFYAQVGQELAKEPTAGLTPAQLDSLKLEARSKQSQCETVQRKFTWRDLLKPTVFVPMLGTVGVAAAVMMVVRTHNIPTSPATLTQIEPVRQPTAEPSKVLEETKFVPAPKQAVIAKKELEETRFVPAPKEAAAEQLAPVQASAAHVNQIPANAPARPMVQVPEIAARRADKSQANMVLDVARQEGRDELKKVSAYNGDVMSVEADMKVRLPSAPQVPTEFNTEAYDRIVDNEFQLPKSNPLSTFSIDVDTASYTNARRFLNMGQLPPPDSVRIEEFINYFDYSYAPPTERPFATHVEIADAPWAKKHRLIRIGIKGKELQKHEMKGSNLMFLIDTSGSMQAANKLPLLRDSLKLLVNGLSPKDRVGIVVYAGAAGMVLPSTSVENRRTILDAIDALEAGGSTNGAAGIELAYQQAIANFIPNGNNRVLLATDGDFNVGTTNQGDLIRLIEEKAKKGVFLTVLGYGMGNYKDSTLEKLADKGNGNYAYIDTINEARKVLVEQAQGTLFTIAKDVKIQIEFNPNTVGAYRLIGYENRLLAHEDFNNDAKDAGEIGAGHTVTALYEVVPPGVPIAASGVDALKYQKVSPKTARAHSDELATLKLRYKEPNESKSSLIEYVVRDGETSLSSASADFKQAAAAAAFGMLLRDSKFKGDASFDLVLSLADDAASNDKSGYRKEFLELVRKAKTLK